MVRSRIVGFTSGRSQDDAECGVLEMIADAPIKFVLKNMQEGLSRRMMRVMYYEDITIKNGHLPYIPNIPREKIRQIPIGFPLDKADVMIQGSLEVLNETMDRRAVTTHDIQFEFDGEPVDWKPTRQDRIMILRPNEGVRMGIDTVTDSILDSKDDDSLFRIANVHPCEVAKDKWRIWYKLQDITTIQQVIGDTFELVIKTLRRLRTNIFNEPSEEHNVTYDMFERESTGTIKWICDKSIANLILARCLAPNSGIKNCIVHLSPDQIKMVRLTVNTTAAQGPVGLALRKLVERIEHNFDRLLQEFERCKKVKKHFIDMMKLKQLDHIAFRKYVNESSPEQ